MPKKIAQFQRIPIELDTLAEKPLHAQIYERIRSAILSGQLQAGQRLPSTRMLASELGISRNTTSLAYEQLLIEGYLHSKVGQGTTVSPTVPEELFPAPPKPQKTQVQPETSPVTLSRIGNTVSSTIEAGLTVPIHGRERPHPFRAGVPALDAFPYKLWTQLLARRARNMLEQVADYQQAVGYQPLREAIATHIGIARGVLCQPEQVIIVAGAQAAFDLSARLLLNPGDQVWVEDPGYFGARRALHNAGAQLVPIPIHQEGIAVHIGRERAPRARLALVTPSHQFPLGMTMSLQQRLALLEWATQANAWILEDDYDSEYRYNGRPLEALQGLDQTQRVIYIGTFSKVLFPALRLGYLVVPPALIEPFTALQLFSNMHAPILEQMALTDFMLEGHFVRHIRHMRTLYKARVSCLVTALQNELPDMVEFSTPQTGMHLTIKLPHDINDKLVARRASEQGLEVFPLSQLFLESQAQHSGLVLGYAAYHEEAIQTGVKQLARVLREL